MGLAMLLARVALRRRRLATSLLALLLGAGAGLAIAAVAGARRNDAAIPHLLSVSRADSVGVAFAQPGDVAKQFAQVKAIPEVRDAARATPLIASTLDVVGEPHGQLRNVISTMMDPSAWAAPFGRPLVVAGRMPDSSAADEVAMNEQAAARRHVTVGGHLRIGLYRASQQEQAGEAFFVEPARTADVTVVGIVRGAADLEPFNGNSNMLFQDHSNIYAPAGFWRRYGPDLASYGTFVDVQLRNPADGPAFAAAVNRRFGDTAQLGSGTDEIASAAQAEQRGANILSRLLEAAAAILALTTLVLGGQALRRQLLAEADDVDTLRALGCSTRTWTISVVLRTGVIAFGAAVVAVTVAFALSPRFPIGVARRASLRHSTHVDWVVFGAGALFVVVSIVARGLVTGYRLARPVAQHSTHRPRLANRAAGLGFPVAAVAGLQFGFEPERRRGLREVPGRLAITAVAIAVVAGAATLGFAASLHDLTHSPRAQGASYDLQAGNFSRPDELPRAVAAVRRDPDITDVTAWVAVDVNLNGHDETLVVLGDQRGHIAPIITQGREPTGAGEIALGANTMRALHTSVGGKLDLELNGAHRTVTVVGREVADALAGADESLEPGKGAVTNASTVRRLVGGDASYQVLLLRLRPGADPNAVALRLQRTFPDTVATASLALPDTVVNVQRAVKLLPPLVLAIAALAAGTLAHALATTVRRRRRDLALLKTFGLRRRQVGAVLVWQAVSFAMFGLAAGIPLGIVIGRWTWQAVTTQLGVAVIQRTSATGLLTLAVVTLATVVVIATLPAVSATRTRTAVALRTE
jgi:hypothetical protein